MFIMMRAFFLFKIIYELRFKCGFSTVVCEMANSSGAKKGTSVKNKQHQRNRLQILETGETGVFMPCILRHVTNMT